MRHAARPNPRAHWLLLALGTALLLGLLALDGYLKKKMCPTNRNGVRARIRRSPMAGR